jgi:hypothetical protein
VRRTPPVTTQCLVVRGLAKEVEEDLNKFLSTHPVRVVHMAQSESANHVTVTLLYERMDPQGWGEAIEPVS